jgi:hypothetical protein
MATHHQLPIFKVAYDLLSLAIDVTKNIRRDIKQSLGSRISDECCQLLVLIARANAARDKSSHLMEIIERAETIDFLMRILKDKGFIGVNQHASAIQLTASIGKQANGWKRSSKSASAPVV